MHKKNCKIIGHRTHENSGLKCLIYNPIHDNVIITYTITLDIKIDMQIRILINLFPFILFENTLI